MCGISGVVNLDGQTVKEENILTMMDRMKHRGPDDQGTFTDKNVGFGFVRLSILDLSSAGHQPMFSSDGRYVMIFNGEVYNYLELKAELSSKYSFRSGTDTEVILTAYQEWGEDCLTKFNGMFALVIFDTHTREVFGTRDRFGIKPLYYYLDGQTFIFASEIKSILPFVKSRRPNDKIVYDYLMYNRTDHTNETFFEGIYKLEHGSYFKIQDSKISFSKWYRLEENLGKHHITPEEYRELFRDSLKLRLRSDVPVGVCLSGGMDSSAIAASLVKDFGLNELNTFSAVYHKDEPSDESRYISEFESIVKNMYYTTPTADTFYDDYENFIIAHNEPVPDIGPYAQYKVMELATNYVTVTLDGQGADEQLAGYHYFFGSYYVELLKKLNLVKLIKENVHYLADHRSLNALKYFVYYLMPEFGQRMVNRQLFPSVKADFYDVTKDPTPISQMLYNPGSLQDSLLQHFEYKLEHLLRWEDLNSMSFSIESRVPFLDHRIVQSTIPLESHYKIKNGTTKYILRESMRDIVPDKIYHRKDKKGFSNPREKWLRSDKFQNLINDLLTSKKFQERGYFDSAIAQNRYKQHLSGDVDISREIWKWINLEIWFNKFID